VTVAARSSPLASRCHSGRTFLGGPLGVAVWLIATNWLSFLDVIGDPQDSRQVARGGDLILVALDPYLTAQAR
jgi:hypothetical protein